MRFAECYSGGQNRAATLFACGSRHVGRCLSRQITNDSVAPALRWAPEWPQRGHCHHLGASSMFSTRQLESLRYIKNRNALTPKTSHLPIPSVLDNTSAE